MDISSTGPIVFLSQASIIKEGLGPKSKLYANLFILDLTFELRRALFQRVVFSDLLADFI